MNSLSGRSIRSGAVIVLVFLFTASAGFRLVASADTGAMKKEEKEETVQRYIIQPEEMIAKSEVQHILDAILKREKEAAQLEIALQEKEENIQRQQEEIDQKLSAVQEAEKTLRDTLALAQTAAEVDISSLVAVYENMKPKQAAELFKVMDAQFAAGFIARMNSQHAASIMANLPPETSYTISAILAGRNASTSFD